MERMWGHIWPVGLFGPYGRLAGAKQEGALQLQKPRQRGQAHCRAAASRALASSTFSPYRMRRQSPQKAWPHAEQAQCSPKDFWRQKWQVTVGPVRPCGLVRVGFTVLPDGSTMNLAGCGLRETRVSKNPRAGGPP